MADKTILGGGGPVEIPGNVTSSGTGTHSGHQTMAQVTTTGTGAHSGTNTFSGTTNLHGNAKVQELLTKAHSAGGAHAVYERVYEIDFDGRTPTATDNGMIKTVATLPADAALIDCNLICSETFAPNQTLVLDLVTTATTVGSNAVTTAVVEAIANFDLDPDTTGGAGKALPASNLGANTTGVTLAFINKGTGNGTAEITAGKVLVYLKYIGSAAPVTLTTL